MRSLLALAVVAACAHAPVRPAARGPTCPDSRQLFSDQLAYEPLGSRVDLKIVSVDVTGVSDPKLAATLRGVIQTKPSDLLESAPIGDDLRRLWALGVVSDARVEVTPAKRGLAVAFVVAPQPLIDHVTVIGADPSALELRRLRWLAGTPYEPVRIQRIAAAIQEAYVHDGHLDAKVEARRTALPGVALCVAVDPGPRVTFGVIRFPGRHAVPESKLLSLVHGADTGRNHAGGFYDEDSLVADGIWMTDAYFERGYANVRIGAPRTHRRGNRIDVELPIDEGPVFHLGAIRTGQIAGRHVDSKLHRGDLFVRSKIITERERLEKLLGPDASVSLDTHNDLAAGRIDLMFRIDWRWPWLVLRSLSWL